MTTDSAAPPPARRSVWHAAAAWLKAHDPEYDALRRAVRTAVVVPIVFAFVDKVIGNPAMATFAAFGSFAMLLLVDFSGPIRDRVLAQTALGMMCAVLIALATLASRSPGVAAVAMAWSHSRSCSSASSARCSPARRRRCCWPSCCPSRCPATAASIPDRVAGWGLAAAVSVLAVALLWPAPARNPLRESAIAAAGRSAAGCGPTSHR